ncbi:MAG: hypothetical protein EXS16_19445 [Gemmataceae bacterium]|nr:hypothetical protein [Gemmataceae bacterium]
MIVGYHAIFGTYGFWLPNDPRGSWSDFVGSWDVFRYGSATKVNTMQSVAYQPHDQSVRIAAKKSLKYPPVSLTGVQARAIGRGFAEYVNKKGITVSACAILPDHIHMVIDKSELKVEQIVTQLKGAATEALVAASIHPFGEIIEKNGRHPKCFARGEWKVFLEVDDIPRAIGYVEENPEKEGKPRQTWTFETPYAV